MAERHPHWEPIPGHVMVYQHSDGMTVSSLKCLNEPGAACRRFSKEDVLGDQVWEDLDYCLAVTWMEEANNWTLAELGPDTVINLMELQVTVHWDGDDWAWDVPEKQSHGMASDQEYIAKVIADGRMIGASWMDIAYRLVQTDLPGMGYKKEN